MGSTTIITMTIMIIRTIIGRSNNENKTVIMPATVIYGTTPCRPVMEVFPTLLSKGGFGLIYRADLELILIGL